MMPSHVIADQLNIDVTAALLSQATRRWSIRSRSCGTPSGTSSPGIDLKRFPSSGPYKIDSVLDRRRAWCWSPTTAGGAPKPITKRITVWPQGADIQDRINSRERRRGRRRGRVVGIAGHPGQLPAHRFAVGRHRAADLRAAGAARADSERAARSRCARRATRSRVTPGCPIANSRLSPAAEDAVAQADGAAEAGQFSTADPDGGPRRAAAARRWRCGSVTRGPTRGWRPPSGRSPSPAPAAGITVPAYAGAAQDRRGRRRCGTARSTCCWPAPAAPPAAGRADRRRWTPTTCTAATATTCPATQTPDRRHYRRAGGIRRPDRARQAARRGGAGAVGRHADAAAVPAAAHAADVEEDVCGEQRIRPAGARAGTWTDGS